jgi:hypothetical protein
MAYDGPHPFKGPIRAYYIGNSIHIDSIKGKHLLKPYTLRKEGKGVVFLVAECCKSSPVAWHPFYDGKIFVTNP